MPKGGKTKLTAETQEKICQYLRAGCFRRTAAALVRIDEATFSRWYQTGAREPRGRLRTFFEEVNLAEAQFEAAGLAQMRIAAQAHPKAWMLLLSRRFPSRWGRRDNVMEADTAPGQANVEELRELLLSRLERLAQPAPKADAEAEADAE
jgi:hypothetical protein